MQAVPVLAAMLEARKPGWLAAARAQDIAVACASAARALGKDALQVSAAERDRLASAGVSWAIDHWSNDELGRVVLLLGASEAVVRQAFFRGDNRERRAVLDALPLRADAAQLVDLAVEACRTNVVDVFCAIACENPFPSRHFAEPAFNQMVMKAIFLDVSVARILGLAPRVTRELVRMATDYAAERRAAGRPVPTDVSFLDALAGGAT